MSSYVDEIAENGFAIIPEVIDFQTVTRLREELDAGCSTEVLSERRQSSYGIRDVLNVVPALEMLETDKGLRSLVDPIEGENARIVRSIFFDKIPNANWKVAWHQDLTIAVREKIDIAEFTAWSVKAGITHVQPPVCVLEQIVTIRLHLDDTDERNGALRVLPDLTASAE